MAGTDRSKEASVEAKGGDLAAPVMILVNPQMGENIGAACRIMLNFGLTDLRLVAPRDGWPNPKAESMAAGAKRVLDHVRIFDTTAEAVADLSFVVGSTARPRNLVKPVSTPPGAIETVRRRTAEGARCGILFGPERTGLANEDIDLCDQILTVPLNPAFASLNLAQAVALVVYEWARARDEAPALKLDTGRYDFASKRELEMLFEHLGRAVDWSGFIRSADMRGPVMRNLKSLLTRAQLTEQEVRTLRGLLQALMLRGASDEEAKSFPAHEQRRRAAVLAQQDGGDDEGRT